MEILKSHKSRQLPICNKTITCRPQQEQMCGSSKEKNKKTVECIINFFGFHKLLWLYSKDHDNVFYDLIPSLGRKKRIKQKRVWKGCKSFSCCAEVLPVSFPFSSGNPVFMTLIPFASLISSKHFMTMGCLICPIIMQICLSLLMDYY